jgi:hypothetical protein
MGVRPAPLERELSRVPRLGPVTPDDGLDFA